MRGWYIVNVVFLLLPVGAFAQSAKIVNLCGTLVNFSNQVIVDDLSDLQYLLPPDDKRVIIPDSAGHFNIRFALSAPGYFRIGRNTLYLSPGDQLELVIDKNDPRKAVFTGTGSAANLYLRHTPFPKGGSYIESGRNSHRSADATIKKIMNLAQERERELATLSSISTRFKQLEAARIKADIINSLHAAEISVYLPRLPADSLQQYKADYKFLKAPLLSQYSGNFINADFMQLVVYRDIADGLLANAAVNSETQPLRDWYSAYQLVQRMNQVNSKTDLAKFTKAIDSIKTTRYKNALTQSLSNLLKFGKGDKAVNFIANTMDGKTVDLSSLKGNIIYIDLWATWCGPCLVEMPHFEQLKERYKDSTGISFLSLSIDDNVAAWKKNVASRNAGGLQWLINRNQLMAYNIVGIPRSIIIDKAFSIVDMNAPLPSATATLRLLDGLLK